MNFLALWFGGLTSSAFLYGVALGMWLHPPLTWTVSGSGRAAAAARLHPADGISDSPRRRAGGSLANRDTEEPGDVAFAAGHALPNADARTPSTRTPPGAREPVAAKRHHRRRSTPSPESITRTGQRRAAPGRPGL